MSEQNPLTDPAALLRRIIAAHDALRSAEPARVDAARDALGALIEEARRAVTAHERWRREKHR